MHPTRSSTDVLVIAPHPDDEVLGCGGSTLIHRAAGRRVDVLFLTSGELGSAEQAPDRLAEIREAEARSAADTLGIDTSRLTFVQLGDGRDVVWLSGWRGAASVGGHREVFTVLWAERLL